MLVGRYTSGSIENGPRTRSVPGASVEDKASMKAANYCNSSEADNNSN